MINEMVSGKPTLCSLYNDLHLTELLGQFLVGLLGLADVSHASLKLGVSGPWGYWVLPGP
jgi:hypothetical protein